MFKNLAPFDAKANHKAFGHRATLSAFQITGANRLKARLDRWSRADQRVSRDPHRSAKVERNNLGSLIGRLVRTTDIDEAKAILATLHDLRVAFDYIGSSTIYGAVEKVNGRLKVGNGSVNRCSRCGAYEFDDLTDVYLDRLTRDYWCKRCTSNHAWYSEYAGVWFKSDDDYIVNVVVGGLDDEDILREAINELRNGTGNIADTDLDVEPVTRQWARGNRRESYCCNGVYFESDEDRYVFDAAYELPDPGELGEYHRDSARGRGFVEQSEDGSPCLGVELEVAVECEEVSGWSRSKAVERLREAFPGIIIERDSSLSSAYGFELVTQPLGKKEWADYGPMLLEEMIKVRCRGYQAPAGKGYGIHVNVHRRHFTPLAEARVAMFMCAATNRDFVRAIAQRDAIYHSSAGREMGGTAVPANARTLAGNLDARYHATQHLSTYYVDDGSRTAKKISGTGKYSPVYWHWNSRGDGTPSVAEFRLFQSTLHLPTFMKNLEFVWAMIEWTKPASCSGHRFHHRDFVEWLCTPANRRAYPNLINYVSRPAFTIKGGEKITNTWIDLLHKPITEEIEFPAAA